MAHISITASPAPPAKPKDFDEFLRTARKRFKLCQDAESEIRREALDDLNFRAGNQWPQTIKLERDADKRPCLTINRIPQFLKQVVNEQRQNRPAIQINPVGDGADTDTAEVLQGLIRHIEINSNADVAYDTGFEHAATMGFGYIRVRTEYQDDKSFDQEIIIDPIKNPFTVYIDPSCTAPDYSDMRFAFIAEWMPKEEYQRQFPDSQLAGLPDFASIGDGAPDWFADGAVLVVEYFHIESRMRTLCVLLDGSTAFKDETDQTEFIKTRQVEDKTVEWHKLNAVEPLETTAWAGKWIPIIPVLGDEIIVDGKRSLVGIVRYAKDAQRQYNYMRSAVVEMIALAPKAPFIAAEGQLEGFENQWASANTRNYSVLQYKPKALGGNVLGAPQRNSYEPPIQAATMAIQQADQDLKATTGIYDASLGQQGPEQSGKAILARQKQGDTANFNLIDNLSRSIRHLGNIILDLIPTIYDQARVIRIVKPDQTHKTIAVNQPTMDGGVEKTFDLRNGKYDVTITVGPSYQSRRQEAVASMLELIKADPNILPVAGDLLVGNMDWPGADQIAERLKKMLPPQLQDNEDAPPIPPQAQAQLAQLQTQNQQLTQALQMTQQKLETKILDLESRERIASENNQTAMIVADLKNGSAQAMAMMQQEFAAITKRLDMLHESEPIGVDAAPHGQPIGNTPEPEPAAPAA